MAMAEKALLLEVEWTLILLCRRAEDRPHPRRPLARGIREAAQALDKRQAHLVYLHPTVMSLCTSSWWRLFVLNPKST
ncbi:hypothetical protein MDA_GLEAN10015948 [Myotis davidii]|uniref:Uncharacterized protein n=1 Tax=Myotis davidii TaxID=225400 RepID=L5M6W6_MYODS|nr:hypothetical protein MDA_GLEAN10015948 [Myotis davidii]